MLGTFQQVKCTKPPTNSTDMLSVRQSLHQRLAGLAKTLNFQQRFTGEAGSIQRVRPQEGGGLLGGHRRNRVQLCKQEEVYLRLCSSGVGAKAGVPAAGAGRAAEWLPPAAYLVPRAEE